MDSYYEFDAYELEKKIVDGSVYQIGRLDGHIRQLLTCAINSEDISAAQEKFLQAALATQNASDKGRGG